MREGRQRATIAVLASAGCSIAGVDTKVVGLGGEELADSHVDEIDLRSHYMLSGCFNRSELTSETWRYSCHYADDFGLRVDQYWYIIGRKSDLIIVGSKNIHDRDLEAAFCWKRWGYTEAVPLR